MNALINENNKQFQINEQINQRIELITNTINNVISNTTMANRIILTELEMITTIINIDTVNAILEDIQDAIVRTKVELPSNKILSLKEIISIKELLVSQRIKITLPDEVLQYVTPKIAMNNEILLYILHVPKLEEENAITMRIIPLTVNKTTIKDYPQYLVRSKQRLFTTVNHKSFIQKHSEIKEFKDECIRPLALGSESHCNVTSEEKTTIQFISEDKILINNANNELLTSNCGPDNRTLTGNFLITFGNCTILINNKKFQAYEIRSETQEIQGALHNIMVNRKLDEEGNIERINQESIQNRKHLENVYLKQIDHQKWIWTLSGGLSFSSIGMIITLAYICSRKHGTSVNVGKVNETPMELRTPYFNLLEEARSKTKNEDVLSSPPGGVTSTQAAFQHNVPTL